MSAGTAGVQQLQGAGEEIWSPDLHHELPEPVHCPSGEAVQLQGPLPVFSGMEQTVVCMLQCMLGVNEELRMVLCLCVLLNRWRLNHQKAGLMHVVITALKPAKWPMMFKGTKVLLYCRKKQHVTAPRLQPTLPRTLLSLVFQSQSLQVHQCKACLTAQVRDLNLCAYQSSVRVF